VRGKYLEDFASGMLASLCYTVLCDPTHAHALRRLQRISPWVGGGVAGLAGVALAGMALATHGALFAPAGVSELSGLSGLVAALASSEELALSLGFASGILAILFGGSRVRRVFAWMPLRWIGLISYSLYIWHLPLLVVFMHQLGPSLAGLPALFAYALYWAWVGVVVIPFAAGVYWLVEKPGMRMGERMPRALFAGRRRTSSTATLDRQSITVDERDGPHGYDGAKNASRRKRHLLADTPGLVLGMRVPLATIQDRVGAWDLLLMLRASLPPLELIWADAAAAGVGPL
jgi:peptidoglycan/LPS O-acetylase OafA/YrhL